MDWRKRSALLVFLLLIGMFVVSCEASEGSLSVKGIWDKVTYVGSLKFIEGFTGDNALVGFMRILVAILVFALLFEGSRVVGLSRNISLVVCGILAIMSAMFIPGAVLAGIGAAYGTLVSLILIGVPVAGGLYAVFRIPTDENWQIVVRIVILLILLWILMAVSKHAATLV